MRQQIQFGYVLELGTDSIVPEVGSAEYYMKMTEKEREVVYIISPYNPASRLPSNQPDARSVPYSLKLASPSTKSKRKEKTLQNVACAYFIKKCTTDTGPLMKLLIGRVLDMAGPNGSSEFVAKIAADILLERKIQVPSPAATFGASKVPELSVKN